MNLEQLKLIIDALNNLGVNAKEAFFWWLIVNYGLGYLIGILWTIIGFIIVWKGIKLGEKAIIANTQIGKLAEAAGVGSWFDRGEFNRAKKIISENWNK